MASSENLPVFELSLEDVDAGLRLSGEAHWNQISEDWQLFIRHGKVFGLRSDDGQLIASAAALPYKHAFGYISMVLVTEKWRRQGLATRLVDHCIGWLRKQQLIPMLDATNAGAEVYRRQGFMPLFKLDRWQLSALTAPDEINDLARAHFELPAKALAQAIDPEVLVRIDAEAVGAQRGFLVNDFFSRKGTHTFVVPDGNGFAMIRRGQLACQIGPVVAQSQTDAIHMLAQALDSTNETIFIDVSAVATQVGLWLKNQGFSVQRSFLRMALGRSQPFGAADRLIASAGPEFG